MPNFRPDAGKGGAVLCTGDRLVGFIFFFPACPPLLEIKAKERMEGTGVLSLASNVPDLVSG